MEVFYTPHFTRDAKRLPNALRKTVEERLKRFKENPFDPSLKTHKLKGKLKNFWSFSIDHKIRILFEFEQPLKVVLHSIGDHAIYDES